MQECSAYHRCRVRLLLVVISYLPRVGLPALSRDRSPEGSLVAGATVFVAGAGDIRNESINFDGRYSIDVPHDTYRLSVRVPDYSATTATGVDVSGATVTRDVVLSTSSFSLLLVFGEYRRAS